MNLSRTVVAAVFSLAAIFSAIYLLTPQTNTEPSSRDVPRPSLEIPDPAPQSETIAHSPIDSEDEPHRTHPPAGASVSGRVYDTATGRGLSGARLYANPRAGDLRKTTTDDDGAYLFDELQPGPWTIRLQSGSGYPSVPADAEVPKGVALDAHQPVTGLDFPLDLGVTVSGVVQNESGTPLAGAEITARHPQPWMRATTGGEGRFMLTGLSPRKELKLRTVKPAYAARSDAWTDLDEAGLDGVVITLSPESSLSGIVVDRNGVEVTRATVRAVDGDGNSYFSHPAGESADWREGRVLGDEWHGRFEVRGLPAGHYRLYAHKEPMLDTFSGKLQTFGPSVRGEPVMELDLGHAEHREELRLELAIEESSIFDGHVITGVVHDAAGEPLPGARVGGGFRNPGARATSDEEGRYRLRLQHKGTFTLSASAKGYGSVTTDSFSEDTREVNIELQRQGQIRGRVLAAGAGTPVTTFEVARADRPTDQWDPKKGYTYERVSHPNGAFTLDGLESGKTTLVVRAEGFGPTVQTVPVHPGATSETVVHLEPGLTVRGRVVDPEGTPVASAEIFVGGLPSHLEWEQGNARAAATFSNTDGTFTLASLPADTARISAYSPAYDGGSAAINGNPDTVTEVRIQLGAGGVIEGVVRLGGAPIGGQTLRLQNDDLRQGQLTAETNHQGRYRFTGLPSGEWEIETLVRPDDSLTRMYRDRRTVHVLSNETQSVNFSFGGNASVAGEILGLDEHDGVVDIMVSWKNADGNRITANAESGDEGWYRVDHLAEGPAHLRATLYTEGATPRSVETEIDLIGGHVVQHDFDFTPTAILEGYVSYPPEAESAIVMAVPEAWTAAHPNATVSVWRSEAVKHELLYTLNQSGPYVLAVNEPGAYAVRAVARFPDPSKSPVVAETALTIAPGDTSVLDFDLR